ncbi:hypothetical protein GCM10017602_23030 [Herbiconiux flava]|nr:hypothetical protein GCM10017602_23030 [Herbiconiux flava]
MISSDKGGPPANERAGYTYRVSAVVPVGKGHGSVMGRVVHAVQRSGGGWKSARTAVGAGSDGVSGRGGGRAGCRAGERRRCAGGSQRASGIMEG